MTTNDDNGPSFFARYINGPEKERLEPERIRIGRDTVLQWMQLCIDTDAIKLEEAENSKTLNLGSNHKLAWIATDYLYESYLATCRQQSTWYPVNKYFFGKVLTKMLGPKCRSTVVPEDLMEIMFRQGKRPRYPWGHLIPSGKIWQALLDMRLYISTQIKTPKSTRLTSSLPHDGRVGSP
jgi:phage/plasmid-associated DNA primase